MEHNNDFRYDLKLGQVGEGYLSKILTDKKIEVKTDFKAMKTGNVFVEYKSRGKLSGISTSESDFYAFILSNELVIIIKKEHLKAMCRIYLNTNRDVSGGDSNTSKGILLPIKDLIKTL